MATKVMNNEAGLGIDPAIYEESTKRIRELNEKLMENAKSAGRSSLDAYEMALTSLVKFEQQVAGGSQLEWVSALARTHATFMNDLSSAYTKAARELIG
jgi:hypothetical protein